MLTRRRRYPGRGVVLSGLFRPPFITGYPLVGSRGFTILRMLTDGIEPTAGFGIGVERLTRFFCSIGSVWEARFCPKVPGGLLALRPAAPRPV